MILSREITWSWCLFWRDIPGCCVEKRLNKRKGKSKDSSYETIIVIQMRDDGSLDQGGGGHRGNVWFYIPSIFWRWHLTEFSWGLRWIGSVMWCQQVSAIDDSKPEGWTCNLLRLGELVGFCFGPIKLDISLRRPVGNISYLAYHVWFRSVV